MDVQTEMPLLIWPSWCLCASCQISCCSTFLNPPATASSNHLAWDVFAVPCGLCLWSCLIAKPVTFKSLLELEIVLWCCNMCQNDRLYINKKIYIKMIGHWNLYLYKHLCPANPIIVNCAANSGKRQPNLDNRIWRLTVVHRHLPSGRYPNTSVITVSLFSTLIWSRISVFLFSVQYNPPPITTL